MSRPVCLLPLPDTRLTSNLNLQSAARDWLQSSVICKGAKQVRFRLDLGAVDADAALSSCSRLRAIPLKEATQLSALYSTVVCKLSPLVRKPWVLP